ncbi:MAG: RNA methyltransferase [Bacteroidales bacterium]|nr:RNA methyltransferase [Bacteroidales bacterium]
MRKTKNEELGRLTVDEFRKSAKAPVVVVLDNIRSLWNIGSIFRTADAFRLTAVHLCGITATPPHREIQKSALGATDSMAWQYFPETLLSISDLKREGYTILGLEQTDSSLLLNRFNPGHLTKMALVVGNEVNGLSENILDQLDASIEIPQFGTKHSLNVAVSTGILIWDMFVRSKMFSDL